MLPASVTCYRSWAVTQSTGTQGRGYGDTRRLQRLESLSTGLQAREQIFKETKTFPNDERYSMTSQIRRCSRSVAANLAEGYRKRQYPSMFVSKLADSDAEATETQIWLDFARDCGYLSEERHKELAAGYDELGRMLSGMISKTAKFAPT